MNICGLTTGLDLISAAENNTDSILKPRLSIKTRSDLIFIDTHFFKKTKLFLRYRVIFILLA